MKEESKEMRLEEAMRRLDEVVNELNREDVELEKAMKLYEEGVRLIALCQAKLEEAERTIRILTIDNDGEILEEPFAHNESK